MKIASLVLALFFLISCSRIAHLSQKRVGEKVFHEEKCAACHQAGFADLGGKYSDDWHYAHFWDPNLVVPGSTMPRYNQDFKIIAATISQESRMTPSGQKVYLLKRTPALESLFTFSSEPLIYLYPSVYPWKTLPAGLKAFTGAAAWGEKPAEGSPAVWASPEAMGLANPGASLTLIVPTSRLKALVDYLQSMPPFHRTPWLAPIDSHFRGNDTHATVIPGPRPHRGRGAKAGIHAIDSHFCPFWGRNDKEGRYLYNQRCVSCHGISGDGLGPASLFLYPKPRNFTSGQYKLKTSLFGEEPTDADLYRTLTHGMPGTSMPAWSTLTPQDRWNLAAYLKTLAIQPTRKPKDVLQVKPPPYSSQELADAARQGENLFFGKAKCQDCHGPGLKSADHLPHGDGPSAPSQMDDWGYPVHPPDLTKGIFKRGDSPEEIYITITTGIAGTPMPSYQSTLTDKERWEIAFYVAKLRQTQSLGTVQK